MNITKLDISLTVRAPFITQSSCPMDYGLDAALAREDDQFFIPGTLLVGKLREAWLELDDFGDFKQDVCDWLGEEEEEDSQDVLFKPKRLHIGNLKTSAKSKKENNYRIRMDSQRKTVEKGAYLVTERPFAPGESVTFQGVARFVARDESELKRLIRDLEIGLKWVSQVGAYRTVGFGEVIGVDIQPVTESKNLKEVPTDLSRYDLIIHPESAFCLAERRLALNLFKSSDVIPGGAVLGALVTMWRSLLGQGKIDQHFDAERPELGQYFNQLHITHAFPGTDSGRPTRQPLSLVKAGSHLYDVALCEGAGLINGEAPAFSVDWKESADVSQLFGWAEVKRELRVRTAIDPKTRRAADEALFAYEMIVPTIAWHACLDLSDVPESARPKVVEQLQSLMAYGLMGIGRTKTYAQVELQAHQMPLDLQEKEDWVLTLQTPALLCNPDHYLNLQNAYAQVFKELSGGRLELVRFFATQSLAGGYYLWRRFQSPNNYQPYLLTDAGSVFVLRGAVKDLIEKWARKGLPLPKWAVEKYQRAGKPGDFWANCPYIPQNGYGEIAVNLPIHWDKKPSKEDFVPI